MGNKKWNDRVCCLLAQNFFQSIFCVTNSGNEWRLITLFLWNNSSETIKAFFGVVNIFFFIQTTQLLTHLQIHEVLKNVAYGTMILLTDCSTKLPILLFATLLILLKKKFSYSFYVGKTRPSSSVYINNSSSSVSIEKTEKRREREVHEERTH